MTASRAAKDRAYRERHPELCAARVRAWAAANPGRIAERAAQRLVEKRAECLIAHARIRARRKGLLFDLDEPDHTDDLRRRVNAGSCELTGLTFDLTPGRTFASPSLDRKDSALGYLHSNVRVICHGMNAALGDWGESALRTMIAGYLAISATAPR